MNCFATEPGARTAASFLAVVVLSGAVFAGEADVVDVRVTPAANGFSFEVSVRHADEGWDHYADRWEVLGPGGEVLAVRVLAHPHEHEQPFTRRLSGVEIAPEVRRVRVRAHDSVHGDGGDEIEVALPR